MEMLSARLADAFGSLFLCIGAMHRLAHSKQTEQDLVIASAFIAQQPYRVKEALQGVQDNLPGTFSRILFRWMARPAELCSAPLSDSRKLAVATVLNTSYRLSLSEGVYLPTDTSDPLTRLEHALRTKSEATAMLQEVKQILKKGVNLHEVHAHLSTEESKRQWTLYFEQMTLAIQTDVERAQPMGV